MTDEIIKQIWPGWKIVGRPLGQGSFGVVYKASHKEHGVETFAAIKEISIPSDSSDIDSLDTIHLGLDATETYLKSIVDDYIREIELMAKLKGAPNIVNIEDYSVVKKPNEVGWNIYIRMELLTPLTFYLCDKTLTEKEVIKLGCDICTALEICSDYHIIHRDIKPENILVNKFGEYKLGDFGIARRMDNLTRNLSMKFAPAYVAPEVIKGGQYDNRVDIYSLGIVLYRLLNAGRLPFLDPNKQIYTPEDKEKALHKRIADEKLPDPCDASPEMARLILRACAYSPDKRFSSARQMKKALENLLKSSDDPGPEPQKRPKKMVAAVLLVFLLVGSLCLWQKIANDGSDESSVRITSDQKINSAKDDEEIASILDAAELLAENQNYSDALAVIEEGLLTFPDSDQLLEKSEDYLLAMNANNKETILKDAAAYAEARDYPAALALLKNSMEIQGDDTAYQNAYTTYAIAYETEVTQQVDAYIGQNEFYAAERLLIDALEVLPENSKLAGRKADVDTLLKAYENEWETEINNTFQSANTIWMNKLYFGALEADFLSGEQDWYVFTLDSPGCVTFLFYSEMQQSSDYYWDINIRSEKDPSVHLWQKYVTGTTTKTQSPVFALAAGTYYVEIESSEKYSPDTYSFELIHEAYSGNWEAESNNTYQTANEITPNQEYFGVLHLDYLKEQDWFTFDLQGPSQVYLLFNSAFQKDDSFYWDVSIRSGSNPENKLWQKYITGHSVSTQSDLLTLGAGKYYVEIESSNVHSTDIYSIILTSHES